VSPHKKTQQDMLRQINTEEIDKFTKSQRDMEEKYKEAESKNKQIEEIIKAGENFVKDYEKNTKRKRIKRNKNN
ncbi:MAG: hypothetical protein NTU73_06930, partial [Ignavibacteriae bacterium]|nr:hypothetical protein [Ignavibacteriota bacterium]